MYQDEKQFPDEDLISGWLDKYTEENADDVSEGADLEKELLTVETMLPFYLRFYRGDFKKLEVVAVEETCEYDWLNKFKLRAKVDLILKSGNYYYTLDHKTMSRVNEDAMPKMLSIDFQHQFYSLLAESLFDIHITGSYHNIIRNPAYDIRGSFTEYQSKLIGELEKRPDHFFKRYLINFSSSDKDNFSRELELVLTEIEQLLKGNRPLYHNVTSCLDFSSCPFLDACSSDSLSGYKQGDELFRELNLPKQKEVSGGKRQSRSVKRT
jgi:hypothetical protein